MFRVLYIGGSTLVSLMLLYSCGASYSFFIATLSPVRVDGRGRMCHITVFISFIGLSWLLLGRGAVLLTI